MVATLALRHDDLAGAQRLSGLSTSEFYRRLREIRYRLLTVGLVERRRRLDHDLLGKSDPSNAT
jgi:hypothetical protein